MKKKSTLFVIGLLLVTALLTQAFVPVQNQPNAVPKSTCGTGSLTVLVVGTGIAKDLNQAELIRLVKVNYDQPGVTVLALPRDLVLDSRDKKLGADKIGELYAAIKAAASGQEKNKEQTAIKEFAKLLRDDYGLQVDRYVVVDLDELSKFMDNEGGLDVTLTEKFTTSNGTVLQPGKQHLSGLAGKEYLISLLSFTGKDSFQKQANYFKALKSKFMTASYLLKFSSLLKTVEQVVTSDVSTGEVKNLACFVQEVPVENIKLLELPAALSAKQTDGGLLPDKTKLSDFFKQTFVK